MSTESDPIAAVCGSEVRIYGSLDDRTQRRPLRKILHFPHHGAAKEFAIEHDEKRKNEKPR
jgi:hypothetical protein